MKIFDWVQRRLNPHQQLLNDDGFGRGVKKGGQSGAYKSSLTLLELPVDGQLGNWRDEILTIGTFGYDPLVTHEQQQGAEDKDYLGLIPFSSAAGGSPEGIEGDVYGCGSANNQNVHVINGLFAGVGQEHFDVVEDYRPDEDDDEELTPLILTELTRGTYYGEKEPCHRQAAKKDHRDIQLPDSKRTTLADLFSADTEMAKSWEAVDSSAGKKRNNKHDQTAAEEEEKELEAASTKKVCAAHLFSKKFIPQGSRSIKKLHKLMRKMLKRKIHPELEGPVQDDRENNNKATMKLQPEPADPEDEAANRDQHLPSLFPNFQLIKVDGAADDSVSLLRIHGNQDAALCKTVCLV